MCFFLGLETHTEKPLGFSKSTGVLRATQGQHGRVHTPLLRCIVSEVRHVRFCFFRACLASEARIKALKDAEADAVESFQKWKAPETLKRMNIRPCILHTQLSKFEKKAFFF